MDTAADLLIVPGAIVLRDDNAGPAGKTGKKAYQEVDERSGNAYGGQGLLADSPAYDDGVHRAVKLLEKGTE